jgi:glucose/arabinose dehydrogenase
MDLVPCPKLDELTSIPQHDSFEQRGGEALHTANAGILLALSTFVSFSAHPAFAQATGAIPSIEDPEFVVETFVVGIPQSPTAMAFVGDDILVLQKEDGQVRLIRNGVLQPTPVLDVNVANAGEQGMLGIAAVNSTVYLYFTESTADGAEPIGRRVYRYGWTGSVLAQPVLLRDMKTTAVYHNGGAMAVAPDGTVYLVVGDTGRYGRLQNHGDDFYPDTSVIMLIAPEGPYHAIGIRNSFGIAFDPYTGHLWDTENGEDSADEINLVEPWTNSGWDVIMGPATEEQLARLRRYQNYTYRDPVFWWEEPVAPTALSFVRSEPLAKLNDSLLVGDCNNGNLYRFVLNEQRDGFVFENAELSDGAANRGDPVDEILFGTDFGCITDIEVGPDGLLYIVSLSEGSIFRVVPSEALAQRRSARLQGAAGVVTYTVIAALVAGLAVYLFRRNRRISS